MPKKLFTKGQQVAWRWASGVAEGKVLEVRDDRTQLTTKGKTITRNGTKENPALIIEHSSGVKVLKLASEVQPTSS